jgi:trimeric autotransporter adhesin
VTNAAAAAIGSIVINDNVPANTRMHYACSGNGQATPNATLGAVVAPANGATGTVSANVGVLAPAQSATLYFCVRIDP